MEIEKVSLSVRKPEWNFAGNITKCGRHIPRLTVSRFIQRITTMGEFDFIADERLRESLEKDRAEVATANDGEAWKAVHVLVGSIVEALLVDYLLGIQYQKKSGTDPLKMDLSELITACEVEGALSKKAVQLCSAIRGYRNLIHPGRVVRLSETVDKNGATVATAVMQMVAGEIAAKRKEQYGYTAEQIVAKLERDQSAMGILGHLLMDMKDLERERLLIKVIPDRFFALEATWEGEFLESDHQLKQTNLSKCFRTTFTMIPEEGQKRVAKQFVAVLRRDDEHRVLTYETAFFQATDLKFLSPTDAALAKQHLLTRIASSLDIPLLKACDGLAKHLTREEISPIVDALVRYIVFGKNKSTLPAKEYIVTLWRELPGGTDGLDNVVVSRLNDWVEHLKKEGQEDKTQVIEAIKAECDDIPF